MRIYTDDFVKVYDPSKGETSNWYINDHTIIRGDDGWHLFGITHEEPPQPLEERLCAHAFTKDILNTPFEKLPPVMQATEMENESHFWAPHIIKDNATYYMFYCAGSLEGHDKYRIHLATSEDLLHWTRHPENPMVIDGFDARDPMILRIGNTWVMYYTCNSAPSGGHHCVACLTSTDLIHWGNKQTVFTSPLSGTYGGPCESPFVEKIGDTYFLFIGPLGGYDASYSKTAVYASSDPFRFGGEPIAVIPSHASEILHVDGSLYLTHCGWGQGGVYLAKLHIDF